MVVVVGCVSHACICICIFLLIRLVRAACRIVEKGLEVCWARFFRAYLLAA